MLWCSIIYVDEGLMKAEELHSACFLHVLRQPGKNFYENSVEQRKPIRFLYLRYGSLPICHHVGTSLNEGGRFGGTRFAGYARVLGVFIFS